VGGSLLSKEENFDSNGVYEVVCVAERYALGWEWLSEKEDFDSKPHAPPAAHHQR